VAGPQQRAFHERRYDSGHCICRGLSTSQQRRQDLFENQGPASSLATCRPAAQRPAAVLVFRPPWPARQAASLFVSRYNYCTTATTVILMPFHLFRGLGLTVILFLSGTLVIHALVIFPSSKNSQLWQVPCLHWNDKRRPVLTQPRLIGDPAANVVVCFVSELVISTSPHKQLLFGATLPTL